MATRPDMNIHNLSNEIRIVETGQTVAQYRVVKDGNADGECQHSAAGEPGFGVVVAMGGNTAVTPGAAGDEVTVARLGGGQVLPVKVGTGGATRGLFAKVVADGVTDATPAGAETTYVFVVGMFAQDGSAGDVVGLYPMPHYLTEA